MKSVISNIANKLRKSLGLLIHTSINASDILSFDFSTAWRQKNKSQVVYVTTT